MKSLGVEAMSSHVVGHVPFARLQPKWGGFAEHDPWVFGEAFVEKAVEMIDCQVRLPKSRQAYCSIARIPGTASKYHVLLQVLVGGEQRSLVEPDRKDDTNELSTDLRAHTRVPFK